MATRRTTKKPAPVVEEAKKPLEPVEPVVEEGDDEEDEDADFASAAPPDEDETAASAGRILMPPAPLLDELRDAIGVGDLATARSVAGRLRDEHPAHAPFFEEILRLAAGFQLAALRERVGAGAAAVNSDSGVS